MPRLMAFDYGTKRVGIAVTDESQIIATPLDTIHPKDIFSFLATYLKEENVEAFILGMPKRLDNTDTQATQHVVGFERKLKKTYPTIAVHLIDERFTSKIAFNSMIEGGMKKKDRQDKAMVDKLSATIILQSYLEQR